MQEVTRGPGQSVETTASGVHGHRQDPLAAGCGPELLERAARHVVGEEVAAGIRTIAGRRHGFGFLGAGCAAAGVVVGEVCGEVEFARALDERRVAFALGNGLEPLLAAGISQVADVPDPIRARVEGKHLRAALDRFAAEDIINLTVAPDPHAVPGVVVQVEPGIVRACEQPVLARVRSGGRTRAGRHQQEYREEQRDQGAPVHGSSMGVKKQGERRVGRAAVQGPDAIERDRGVKETERGRPHADARRIVGVVARLNSGPETAMITAGRRGETASWRKRRGRAKGCRCGGTRCGWVWRMRLPLG